ncbi:UNVERIFIED_CONTAM: Retrovirus-related Pol polyprotein from transposon RE2 [Sesamum radiatum]|uniref:Retrovirus-related Pol polyprotein from transposon RE2 n=1 Tax=Sesamum radiatum TaxID=300843 RepID=A0AAW2K9G0_SESRA
MPIPPIPLSSDEDIPTPAPSTHSSPFPTSTSKSSSPISDTPPPLFVHAPTPLPLRQSTRTSKKPAWLSNFVCNHVSNFSAAHMHFVAQLSILSRTEVLYSSSGHLEWEKAMVEELKALETNNTWEVTSLPAGKKAVGSRWVYKLKLNSDGSVNRYKASLVAKGYNQIEAYSWPVHQLDINNAFLRGSIDEEVYMSPPDGYSVQPGNDLGYVKYFLGLEVARSPDGMSVTQHKYAVDEISDTGMTAASSVSTPLPPGIKLTSDSDALFREPDKYRRLIGRLLYLGFTRLDISFAVQQLS